MSVASGSLVVLLTKARDGDERARDQLFAKCRSYLALVARAQVESWLQAKVDASDLVQQTLLDAISAHRKPKHGVPDELQ